jgi:hypothetical protein
VPGRVDHGHDRQPEDERDAYRAERAAALVVDDDGAAPGEDERERRQRLGERAPRE